MKKEKYQFGDSHARLGVKNEGREVVYMASGDLRPGSDTGKALSTPTTCPFSSVSSPHCFHQTHHVQPYNCASPASGSVKLESGHSKRTFQQAPESELEQSDLDGKTWKRVKVEGWTSVNH